MVMTTQQEEEQELRGYIGNGRRGREGQVTGFFLGSIPEEAPNKHTARAQVPGRDFPFLSSRSHQLPMPC
jgi:hypothetical protein